MLHDNLVDVVAPSTLHHLGDRFLQFGAANCADGGHKNTLELFCYYLKKIISSQRWWAHNG